LYLRENDHNCAIYNLSIVFGYNSMLHKYFNKVYIFFFKSIKCTLNRSRDNSNENYIVL